ncbi:MAG TPA: lipid A biosynthesis acyltransferase, partial [Burkholderiales bacterium]|nr:lipid A biosynthesis acyltransferase [Burkholderiales bacterium]
MIAYVALRKRRRIARTNLELCLPELGARARERLLRRHFHCFGRALLDSTVAWWGSPARLRRVVRIEGQEHVERLRGERFIGLVPHFVGIELEGLRMALDYRGVAVYVRQKDAFVDAFLKRKRERFAGTRMILRQEGVKAILRALEGGQALQLSPDMDLGAKDAVFVPFFGVPAATVTVLSRMARLLKLRIVPLVVRQLRGGRGYVARFYPAWEDYPGASVEDDTRRMNAFIEDRIREMPEQYLWTHRRFKTRPAGERGLY